jgi:polyhydroxyalkanoate synthesis regulator phasin
LLATIINGNSKLTNGQKTSIVNLANKIMLGDCSPITVKSFNDQVNNMVKKGDITKDQGESLKNAVKAICGL